MLLLDTFKALVAPLRLRTRSLGLLVAYLLLAGLILGLVGTLLQRHGLALRAALAGYLLPESYRFAGNLLVEHLVKSQARAVLVNAVASGALLLVSLLLFPLKERLSAAFERDAVLTGKEGHELPLWRQGFEELKLVLLYLTAQMLIFWVGYDPSPLRKDLATWASYGFLVFTFAVDFLSPLLQRHGVTYARLFVVLLKRPLAALLFGAFFASPTIVLALWVGRDASLPVTDGVLVLFGANVLAMSWAVVSGTRLAAALLPVAEATPVPPRALRLLALLAVLACFAWNATTFTQLGLALHHKSQILKCVYRPDWSSFALDLPKSGSGWVSTALRAARALVSGNVELGAQLTVAIENPTPYDVVLEKNRLELAHAGTHVGSTQLSPVRLPAGQTVTQRLRLTLRLNPAVLAKGRELLRDAWQLTLWLEIRPGFEFPLYLRSPT